MRRRFMGMRIESMLPVPMITVHMNAIIANAAMRGTRGVAGARSPHLGHPVVLLSVVVLVALMIVISSCSKRGDAPSPGLDRSRRPPLQIAPVSR
jgi:hypothetical protein